MSDERRYFGTDGVRGKVGQYPITPDFVLKLGWAAGRVLAKQGTKQVIIGKDTRTRITTTALSSSHLMGQSCLMKWNWLLKLS